MGDSRAVGSLNGGSEKLSLTIDHKPTERTEQERIQKNGGRIYQTQSQVQSQTDPSKFETIVGPHRVAPGRLSVSRTFGDLEAKHPNFGGMAGVVICTPEVSQFDEQEMEQLDFLVLGCDGIFDKLTTQETVDVAWKAAQESASL